MRLSRLVLSLMISSVGAAMTLSAVDAKPAVDALPALRPFLKQHCYDCHDSDNPKGDLDLTRASFDTKNPEQRSLMVTIYDRVAEHEMPPKKKPQPSSAEAKTFLATISAPIVASEKDKRLADGRATWRRMNRMEYEATLRDVLQADWLQIRNILPEDGEKHRFNKSGEALDMSHVQMAQYLEAAEYALRAVLAEQTAAPTKNTVRYYARDVPSLVGKMKFSEFNRSPERATFPVLDYGGQADVRAGTVPATDKKNTAQREREAIATVASSYEPIELKFDTFTAKYSGRYTIRLNAYAVWVGPGVEKTWFRPDLDVVSKGRRSEPVTLYGETKPRLLRWLGAVDVGVEPSEQTLEVDLLENETIRVDAARLFRSRPPGPFHNPLATKEGQPAVAFKWLEVTGPHIDTWPSAGHRLLFDNLPFTPPDKNNPAMVIQTKNPAADAERLLRNFMKHAYRRPVAEADVSRFMGVIKTALDNGNTFLDAMLSGYAGVLCSPAFVCLAEQPGPLDDFALASRLSYFLWNSTPDETLRSLAETGKLHNSTVLREQTQRLLKDSRSQRFTEAFLDYWLDLRRIDATSPDGDLYPDYYLDDLLVESSVLETRAYFREMLQNNLPARHLITSDFVMINERLAQHYGIPGVTGVHIRKVMLPKDSPRGGIMTQASVLKVTANGTTTSPVVRGVWIMERMLGKPPPPPPPKVPAVEPDTRGATTIREQLAKHRSDTACASCHTKIDPAGFALENFDVFGGWQDRYRAINDDKNDKSKVIEVGYGKNGQPFAFHRGPVVDASSELPDGRTFKNVRELKQLLIADQRQIARNLAQQLTVYATGTGIHFADRPAIEAILDQAAASEYGIDDLIAAIVQSDLFRRK